MKRPATAEMSSQKKQYVSYLALPGNEKLGQAANTHVMRTQSELLRTQDICFKFQDCNRGRTYTTPNSLSFLRFTLHPKSVLRLQFLGFRRKQNLDARPQFGFSAFGSYHATPLISGNAF